MTSLPATYELPPGKPASGSTAILSAARSLAGVEIIWDVAAMNTDLGRPFLIRAMLAAFFQYVNLFSKEDIVWSTCAKGENPRGC